MPKILAVFGTRPEAIKMGPLVTELKRRSSLSVSVCVTGQHREMLDDVLPVFGIDPDCDLSVMQERQALSSLTESLLHGMRPVLKEFEPDLVLVHGDTTTALAAALSCFYEKIPVGHVEAGLRTYRLDAPFPEEFNRRTIDLIARLRFAPTPLAKERLIAEGCDPETVFLTGNTVIDALRATVTDSYSHPLLSWATEGGREFLLLTAHRRESVGEPMRSAFRGIRRFLETHSELRAVYPVHPNPDVRSIAEEIFAGCGNLRLTGPLSLSDCHNLEARCRFCVTDSGGIQEECCALGKQVLVLRDATERPEGVEAGILSLIGTEEQNVFTEMERCFARPLSPEAAQAGRDLFGDGTASARIADLIEKHFAVREVR
ncbi:MAG: UDP-N-acetylglucosamine 2-epimerase (non-hydrolyzing) [Clostridia bacterium]|nr:UDP-N-acetylglucosamine 2-epimerase (non-hydrolyzing) [Clostridia bacterium]